jgi:hypothetical protein
MKTSGKPEPASIYRIRRESNDMNFPGISSGTGMGVDGQNKKEQINTGKSSPAKMAIFFTYDKSFSSILCFHRPLRSRRRERRFVFIFSLSVDQMSLKLQSSL